MNHRLPATFYFLVWMAFVPQTWAQSQKPVVMPKATTAPPSKAVPNLLHEKKKLIINALHKQQEDWNRGDMAAFLSGYWNSDTLRTVNIRGVTYGWDKVSAQYRKNFPDSASMGKIDYDVIHVELIGENDVLVTGKWLLNMNKKFKAAYFTYLYRKRNGRWVIVAEHTS